MFRCPICQGSMPTNDVNDADHVALGEVVCSFLCHAEAYSGQLRLPLETGEPYRRPNDP